MGPHFQSLTSLKVAPLEEGANKESQHTLKKNGKDNMFVSQGKPSMRNNPSNFTPNKVTLGHSMKSHVKEKIRKSKVNNSTMSQDSIGLNFGLTYLNSLVARKQTSTRLGIRPNQDPNFR